ncbi:MAG: hypothetical protein AAFY88_16815, partial [Acidobacteriota bacterium]
MENRQLQLTGIDSKVGDATLYLEAERARILMANGEELVISRAEQPERLHANRMLGGAAAAERLKDRVDLEFARTNPTFFAAGDAVSLDVDVKNVDTLLVKV